MSTDISSYVANQAPAVTTLPSSSSTDALGAGQANLDTSYQTFLQLLTTQLKNQDPTSPLDTNAFTQQLVQMTGVQQQLLSNTLLQQLVNQGGTSVTGAVGLIGKTVTATSPTTTFTGGQANWGYNLPSTASQATLTVSDSSGRVVWSGAAPDLSSGQHSFTWNGSGGATDGGTYSLAVTAADVNGAAITATTSITGTVTSVSQGATATMLSVGGSQVPFTAVTGVTSS